MYALIQKVGIGISGKSICYKIRLTTRTVTVNVPTILAYDLLEQRI